MKLVIILILIVIFKLSYGQEFLFPLIFEDAIGNKDTLQLGYDYLATDSIDVIFNEENIINVSYSSDFDVRASNVFYGSLSPEDITNPTFQTKKQIIKKCNPDLCYFDILIPIDIFSKYWPIKVHWNKMTFVNDSIASNSLLTDWNPGGWFDGGSGETVAFLKNIDSAVFNNPQYYWINNIDTIRVIWIAIGNANNLIGNTKKISMKQLIFEIHPNPVNEYLNIDINDDNFQFFTIEIYDVFGKMVKVCENQRKIDVRNFNKGLYFFKIFYENSKYENGKIIKI